MLYGLIAAFTVIVIAMFWMWVVLIKNKKSAQREIKELKKRLMILEKVFKFKSEEGLEEQVDKIQKEIQDEISEIEKKIKVIENEKGIKDKEVEKWEKEIKELEGKII